MESPPYFSKKALAITGATIGKVALNASNNEIAISGDLLGIESHELPPEYLQVVLASPMVQFLCECYTTGATNGHLAPDAVKNFPIPILSDSIIRDISEKVKNAITARDEFLHLIQKTKTLLENAIFEGY